MLNAELERLGLSLHNMGDIAEQTLAGATSTGTHGTGGVAAGLAAQLAGLQLVTGTGEVLDATREQNADVFEVARVGLGALGILTTVTFAVEPLFLLEAHEQPMSWDEALGSFDEHGRGEPPLRHVLVPPHRPAAHQAQHPARRRRRRGRAAVPASAAGSTTSFLSNTVFGALTAGANRVPGRDPADEPGRRARAVAARTYSDVAHRVFTSPRRVVFREMEYAVPREAGLDALREARRVVDASDWRISFPVEIRVAPGRRHPAVDGVRPRLLLPGLPHPPRSDWRTHAAYFAAMEPIMRDARRPARTGASCTRGRPPTWRRRTRASASSWRCATGSTPTGCSPTTTCDGCWGTDARTARVPRQVQGAPSRQRGRGGRAGVGSAHRSRNGQERTRERIGHGAPQAHRGERGRPEAPARQRRRGGVHRRRRRPAPGRRSASRRAATRHGSASWRCRWTQRFARATSRRGSGPARRPESVAQVAGTSVDKVMPYAAPVLAERAHVAQRAQRASIRRRPAEGGCAGARTLGDAVGGHLRARNVDPDTVDVGRLAARGRPLDADRRPTRPATAVGAAHFSFDAPGNYVVADDDDAHWLLGEVADAPRRRGR